MVYPDDVVLPPSAEFVNLCQSQLMVLQLGLKTDWSAVYLTQSLENDPDLPFVPIAVYPPMTSERGLTLQAAGEDGFTWAENRAFEGNFRDSLVETADDCSPHQMILPLMYEETILGLLVARRRGRLWEEKEIQQGRQIAQTLAIACFLDQRYHWLQQQQQQQQERLDDLLHQLRNPLTALRTFSQLLLKRLGLTDEKSRTVIEGITRESDRLRDLLVTFEEDLKQNRDNLPILLPSSPFLLPSSLSLEPIALEESLRPVLTSATTIAQEQQITIVWEGKEEKGWVKGNAQALREVFSNLLDNAIKYTPCGGKVKVEGLLEKPNYWGVAIADTGCGIPAEDMRRIFERHYRGRQEQGNIEGSGLGLTIVKELVEKMGGEIEVISPNGLSKENPGTTFKVWLLKHN